MKLTLDYDANARPEDGRCSHCAGILAKRSNLSREWLRIGWNEMPLHVLLVRPPVDPATRRTGPHPGSDLRPGPTSSSRPASRAGGSLVFYASLCKAMDRGRVVRNRHRNKAAQPAGDRGASPQIVYNLIEVLQPIRLSSGR
jgi:hypothetical protein